MNCIRKSRVARGGAAAVGEGGGGWGGTEVAVIVAAIVVALVLFIQIQHLEIKTNKFFKFSFSDFRTCLQIQHSDLDKKSNAP